MSKCREEQRIAQLSAQRRRSASVALPQAASMDMLAINYPTTDETNEPQYRERVFIIGSRDGKKFRFPDPTHVAPDDLQAGGGTEPYRTAWDALSDLPQHLCDPSLKMTGKWADLLPAIPEGENYLFHTSRGRGMPLFGWRTRFWNFLLKLTKDRPSWVTYPLIAGPVSGIEPVFNSGRPRVTCCRVTFTSCGPRRLRRRKGG
jgi:hypothetical protein